MSVFLWIIFAISFFLYHVSTFSYMAYMFQNNKYPVIAGTFCAVVNFAFWAFFITNFSVEYEYLALVCWVLLLGLESKLLFKIKKLHMIFIAVTFTINIFAKRLIVVGIMALLNHQSIPLAFESIELKLLVTIITCSMSIGTINLARKMISRVHLDTILADKQNMVFLTTVLSILFISLFVSFLTYGSMSTGGDILYHHIFTGTFNILAFALFIIYAYFFADLRLFTQSYLEVSQKNKEDIDIVKKLENEANVDGLTDLYTREYANNIMQQYNIEDKKFFVCFIDLDGLKIVNDEHGHEEGDFYIKEVAEIVVNYFNDDIVCRYGGDEIVVVGYYEHEEEVTLKCLKCYNAVSKIPSNYDKPYKTSVSYGVAFRSYDERLSSEQLIAIADARMYELKSKNKKHRKVVSPKYN